LHDSTLHSLASPEQHLLSAKTAPKGHPPAEQAFSSPSTPSEAKLANDGHCPSVQPAFLLQQAGSSPGSEAAISVALKPEQQEPPAEAGVKLGAAGLDPLNTPF